MHHRKEWKEDGRDLAQVNITIQSSRVEETRNLKLLSRRELNYTDLEITRQICNFQNENFRRQQWNMAIRARVTRSSDIQQQVTQEYSHQ